MSFLNRFPYCKSPLSDKHSSISWNPLSSNIYLVNVEAKSQFMYLPQEFSHHIISHYKSIAFLFVSHMLFPCKSTTSRSIIIVQMTNAVLALMSVVAGRNPFLKKKKKVPFPNRYLISDKPLPVNL